MVFASCKLACAAHVGTRAWRLTVIFFNKSNTVYVCSNKPRANNTESDIKGLVAVQL